MKNTLYVLFSIIFIAAAYYAGWKFENDRTPTCVLILNGPPNSAIFINNQFSTTFDKQGEAELTFPPPGIVASVRVEKPLHTPYTKSLTITPGIHHESVQLHQIPTSQLNILTTPSGAVVLLDNAQKGRTPLHIKNLLPGKHTVTTLLTNYESFTTDIYLNPDSTETIQKELEHLQLKNLIQRLQQNRLDLVAHENLWELLLRLGKPVEAGNAAFAALIAVSEFNPRTGTDAEKKAVEKIRNHIWARPRAMTISSQDPGRLYFTQLENNVLNAIREGNTSPVIVQTFQQNIAGRNPEKAIDVYKVIIREQPSILQNYIALLDLLQKSNAINTFVPFMQEIIDANNKDYVLMVTILDYLYQFQSRFPQTNNNEKRPIDLQMDQLITLLSQSDLPVDNSHKAKYYKIIAAKAEREKNTVQQIEYLKKALELDPRNEASDILRMQLISALSRNTSNEEEIYKILEGIAANPVVPGSPIANEAKARLKRMDLERAIQRRKAENQQE